MTEQEMIQQHINECSHRIDVINDFIASNSSAIKEKGEENILILKTAISALEEIQKKQGWIPVTEQLPEIKNNKDIFEDIENFIKSCYLVTDGDAVCIAVFSKDGKFVDMDDAIPFDGIVAWMPLPEPYKPENKTGGAQ